MHLVVVHFYISGQVRASAFIDTDFFPKLCVLHLETTKPILCLDQFALFFFDKSVRRFDLVIDGSIITLHGTLEISSPTYIGSERCVFFPKTLQFRL